jgi:hypothetical protein
VKHLRGEKLLWHASFAAIEPPKWKKARQRPGQVSA